MSNVWACVSLHGQCFKDYGGIFRFFKKKIPLKVLKCDRNPSSTFMSVAVTDGIVNWSFSMWCSVIIIQSNCWIGRIQMENNDKLSMNFHCTHNSLHITAFSFMSYEVVCIQISQSSAYTSVWSRRLKTIQIGNFYLFNAFLFIWGILISETSLSWDQVTLESQCHTM